MTMISCPSCQTAFTPQRCGVHLPEMIARSSSAIVHCMVCSIVFNVSVKQVVVDNTITRSWRAPWRKIVTPVYDYVCVSTVRS